MSSVPFSNSVGTSAGGTRCWVGNWADGIYLSGSPVFDTNATLLGYVFQNHNVQAGGGYGWTNSVNLPQVSAETYYLFAVVDDPAYAGGAYTLYEVTKTNNVSAPFPLAVGVPDLAPVSLVAPASGVSGTPIQISAVVTNQGSGSATGNWADGIYLSSSPVFDTNATLLGYVFQNHNVQAGGGYGWTNSVNLPQVSAGTYYLFVVVDDPAYAGGAYTLYEVTKTNNVSAPQSFAVGIPDLAPISLVAPASGVSGTPVQISAVVTNQAAGVPPAIGRMA